MIRLSSSDRKRIAQLVRNIAGIKLPESKHVMIEGRLRKRLSSLKMDSFSDYCDYLFSSPDQELSYLIDSVTTNKTDFFREPAHFTYLKNKVIPEFFAKGIGNTRSLNVWSAGCSSGEEVYTLSMVLNEVKKQIPSFRFSILGTDISQSILSRSKRAVYTKYEIAGIPNILRSQYLLRSRDDDKETLFKISPKARENIKFGQLNFMDRNYNLPEMMDVIFCRNVLIYFDKKNQEEVINKICEQANHGSYLFLGHSESLFNFDVPLEQVAPTTYCIGR